MIHLIPINQSSLKGIKGINMVECRMEDWGGGCGGLRDSCLVKEFDGWCGCRELRCCWIG